ncbi:Palmitoyltransferase [Komagataella phaffii CBS 7435]|uniref:Palmitoyltransferase n=2 Tax=Komagataella phaffii TaxID=460519 RepID=C4QXI2_KOMPG|nr:Palmitoyltransferase for Vac8p, required for vacuolar membrane fusion [Komagataella phaffii GS115]AOA60819.1 GQ67_02060T0 [Komagataella phaffii]CAH2446769.1 Palmitoyltransferase [Komagataella phaffii CBS 7435]AOA66816.1 GQ68_02075T0 [Komagataella phaffii GS115]CAY67955.1 Palmitoyltransferase for Vac8p, required for vacuolar membrane fusion [Komagataella phaffii GS115]SCV11877.1 Palmitoyltransferase [Komagataella phaffii CBS 7435]
MYYIKRCCCLLASTFPRAFCSGLFLWATYVLCIEIAFKLYGGIIGLVLCTVGVILLVISLQAYCLVVALGPGSPADFTELHILNYVPGMQIKPPHELLNRTVTTSGSGNFRICNKCEVFKPDRSHHCSSCGICILKMDHHCPWFACCIGFKNHKFFVQFLIYTQIYSLLALLVSGKVLYDFFETKRYKDHYLSLNYVFLTVVSFVTFLSLTFFIGFTLYQLFRNKTTIESYESQRYRANLKVADDRYYKFNSRKPTDKSLGNVFDLGWRENFKQVMGNSWYEWLLPIRVVPKRLNDYYLNNGLNYPVNEHVYQKLVQNSELQQRLYEDILDYRRKQKQDQEADLENEYQQSGTVYGV